MRLEKRVDYFVWGGEVNIWGEISVRSIWFIAFVKYSISLSIFFLDDLSIGQSEILKSPNISV